MIIKRDYIQCISIPDDKKYDDLVSHILYKTKLFEKYNVSISRNGIGIKLKYNTIDTLNSLFKIIDNDKLEDIIIHNTL